MSETEQTNRKILASKFVWLDAYEGEGEWYGTDYEPERRLMVTYGYPIAITSTYMSVASTYDADMEHYACVINIPIGMIVDVQQVSDRNDITQASEDSEIRSQCRLNP